MADEPIPLLYYDNDEDDGVTSFSIWPELARPSLAPISRDTLPSTAPIGRDTLPSAAPFGRDALPSEIVFSGGTTESHSSIGNLAPIVDWNNGTYKGEYEINRKLPQYLK